MKEPSLRAAVTMLTVIRSRGAGFIHKFARNRRRLQSKACMCAAVLLLAVFMLTGLGVTSSLPGLSAGRGLLRDNIFMARLSVREDGRYARTLATLLRDDPRVFLRMMADDVKLILDEPDLRRADGPFAVWQYRSETCVLDVYLSAMEGENHGNDTLRVVDYEARPRVKARLIEVAAGGGGETDLSCFDSVISAAAQNRALVVASLF